MLPLVSAFVLLAAPAPVVASAPDSIQAPATWKIDKTHSELSFRIRHLVSRVSGTFLDWDGTITGDPTNWNAGSVTVAIRTASITTNNERRDTHLRSPDFFDAATYPEISFKSTSVKVDGENITLNGDLTMRGVTKPITLTGTYNGIQPGQGGRDRVGFEVSTKVNRLDYGVKYNRAVEGGGTLLGDEVTIQVTVAAVKQVGESQ
ncbi:MAG TPA: YceI family protein [Gemmatimonadales bacterium]|nr:YceI family protein [Gemmatimonadales bacterium]